MLEGGERGDDEDGRRCSRNILGFGADALHLRAAEEGGGFSRQAR